MTSTGPKSSSRCPRTLSPSRVFKAATTTARIGSAHPKRAGLSSNSGFPDSVGLAPAMFSVRHVRGAPPTVSGELVIGMRSRHCARHCGGAFGQRPVYGSKGPAQRWPRLVLDLHPERGGASALIAGADKVSGVVAADLRVQPS